MKYTFYYFIFIAIAAILANNTIFARRSFVPKTQHYGREFMGYDCVDDCSGHEAGYDWAEEYDITNDYDCDGNSDSFIEGCQAYVDEYWGI